MPSQGRRTEYRVSIEGYPVDAVTAPEMEQTLANDRERVAGLQREGIALEEFVDLARASFEGQPVTFKIIERHRDEKWTEVFVKEPTVRTYLSQQFDVGDVVMHVLSEDGISVGDVLHVNTEAMEVLDLDFGGMVMGRLRWDTIDQTHFVNDSGEKLRSPAVTNKPVSAIGRRVRLFEYTDADDLQGDGTQIWLGVVSKDVELEDDATTWAITVDPLWTLFEQDIGGLLVEPVSPRGILYTSRAPLHIDLYEFDGGDFGNLEDADRHLYTALDGHWESQEDFCEALTSAIEGAMSTHSATWDVESVTATPHDKWGYVLNVQCSSGTPPAAFVAKLQNPSDGIVALPVASADDLILVSDVSADSTYTIIRGEYQDIFRSFDDRVGGAGDPPGARTVPRGTIGLSTLSPTDGPPVDHGVGSGQTDDTIYVDKSFDLTVGDLTAASIQRGIEGVDWHGPITVSSASNRRVNIETGTTPPKTAYTKSRNLRVQFARSFAEGHFGDFLNTIRTDSPEHANSGSMPFVTDGDLDTQATIDAAVEESAAGNAVLLNRLFTQTSGKSFAESFQHHCRLYGLYPYTTSEGKIGVRKLRPPTSTTAGSTTINEDTIVRDQSGFPRWEKNARGSINTAIIKTGWDAFEEEHTGTIYRVRDVRAFGVRKSPQEVEIACPSRVSSSNDGTERSGFEFDWEDAFEIGQPIFAIYGRPYAIIEMDVPYTLYSLLIGDEVLLTIPQLPDPTTGTRGIENTPGVVMRRFRELDGATAQLTVLLTLAPISGYAPALTVSSQTNTSGNSWDLTVSTSDPEGLESLVQSGHSISDLFAAGHRIRIVEWDPSSGTPTIESGLVNSVNDGTSVIAVTMDTANTPPSPGYLTYDVATNVTDDSQKKYFFIAGADGKIDFSGDTRDARELG